MSDLPRFGANDFYLVNTDPLVIREKLRDALAEVLGRPVLDSDPHMVLASAFMPFLVQGLASSDAAAKATLRAFAVGADLDRIADSTCVVGYLDRKAPKGAILPCFIAVSPVRQTYTRGGVVTVSWTAQKTVSVDGIDVTFSGSGTSRFIYEAPYWSRDLKIPAYLIADEAGEKYNGLLKEATASPVRDEDISVGVIATDEAGEPCIVGAVDVYRCGSTYGGADTESDDEFSERVAWQAKALRVPGSLEYFKLLLSNLVLLASSFVSSKVDDDGRIIMAWCDKVAYSAAAGGVELSERGAAYDEFLAIVQNSLLVEQRVMAYPAEVPNLSYSIRYWLSEKASDIQGARDAIERAWRLYVSRHAWHCGAILSKTEMSSIVLRAGASRVEITSNMPSDYLPLPADNMLPDSGFTLSYMGLTVDASMPTGTAGEEITP